MAIKDLDFHNYIYLFNDPNQAVFSYNTPGSSIGENVKEKAGLYFSAYNSTLDFSSVTQFLNQAGVGIGYNFFNDKEKLGDVPPFMQFESYIDALRKEYRPFIPDLGSESPSYYANANFISTNMATTPVFLSYFRSINDLALSPYNRHNLVVDGNTIRYKYDKVSDIKAKRRHARFAPSISSLEYGQEGVQQAKDAALSSILTPGSFAPAKIQFFNQKDIPGAIYTQYVVAANKDDYSLISYEGQSEIQPLKNNFTFTQNFWLEISTDFDEPGTYPDIFGVHYSNLVQDYFKQVAAQAAGFLSVNSSRRIVLDAATKIGVPYDYHTVIDGDVDITNYGVKNGTPEYESVYNYFDSQLEPALLSVVNSEILTEPALPSVYDFLYLPSQFNILSSFLDLNNLVSSENFTLANINNYLDNLSTLYGKYLKADGINLDPMGENSTPAISDKNLLDFQYKDTVPPGTPATAVYNTPIAAFFDTEKNKFLNELSTDLSFQEQVKTSKNDFIPKWLEQIKKGVYFSEKSVDIFKQAQQFETTFPFVIKINIPTEAKGPIGKLLSEIDLLDSINSHAASLTTPIDIGIGGGPLGNLQDFGYTNFETLGSYYGGMLNGDNNQLFNLFEEVKLKTFRMYFTNSPENNVQDDPFYSSDIEKPDPVKLDPFLSPSDIYLDTFQEIGLNSPKNVFTYSEEDEGPASVFANLLKQLQGQKFVSRIKKLFTDGGLLRTPSDIHDGKLAHQETLMYEITKYDSSGNFIQSIFIPISELDNIYYLDTQVVPYKDYFYKIFAHKVIVGTKYRMNTFAEDEDGNYIKPVIESQNLYTHDYLVQPYLQFVRVPYYNVPMVNVTTDELNYSRIEDFPPLPPQVQFVPYKNINNKFLLLFNGSTGEVRDRPIPIFDSDVDLFAKLTISQKNKGIKGGIIFRGDDVLQRVDIFRIENKPTEYKDFINDPSSMIETVETMDSSAASSLESILPNKNYYYFFRAVDIHGKISNPTAIYKVVMVSNINSAPYLKVELFNFEKPEKFVDSKSFQKYLFLEANSDHDVVSFPNLTTDANGNALGDFETQSINVGKTTGRSVFGKKYKLRITSKQTGKKIDVNIEFKDPKNIINDI